MIVPSSLYLFGLLDVYKRQVMDYLMERIIYYTNKRAGGKMKIECILYDNQYGELAKSEGAEEFLYELQHENVNANETTI